MRSNKVVCLDEEVVSLESLVFSQQTGQGQKTGQRPLAVGDVVVRVDPRYYRPCGVETLLGDPTKSREVLGWEPKISFMEMVKEMVQYDFDEARRDALVTAEGFVVHERHE